MLFVKVPSTSLKCCFLSWQQLRIQRPPEKTPQPLSGSTACYEPLSEGPGTLHSNSTQGQREGYFFPLRKKTLLINDSKAKREMITLPT